MKPITVGPILIAIAALLWGMDSVFRSPAVLGVDPTVLVLLEHLLGGAVLLFWGLFRFRSRLFTLSREQWIAAVAVGAGGSAIATVLFTASFRYVNPSVAVLIQKLQPVIVLTIAYALLGERPQGSLYLWGLVALGSAVLLSFPNMDFRFSAHPQGVSYARGVLFALLAAILWSASTVGGKILLRQTPCGVALFWRYFFGLLTLGTIVMVSGQGVPWSVLEDGSVRLAVVVLALVTGLIPVLAYYAGLSKTPASVATFVELIYPISAVILNVVFLGTALAPVQIAAAAVLLVAVSGLSIRMGSANR